MRDARIVTGGQVSLALIAGVYLSALATGGVASAGETERLVGREPDHAAPSVGRTDLADSGRSLIERAIAEHQSKVVSPLASGDGVLSPRMLGAVNAASRWIMTWICVGRAAYRVYVAGTETGPVFKIAARELNAIETARAMMAARDQGGVSWRMADASDPRLDATAETEAQIRERQQKAKDALAKWREENEQRIREGLRKLEDFDRARKSEKAGGPVAEATPDASGKSAPESSHETEHRTATTRAGAPGEARSPAVAAVTSEMVESLRKTYRDEMAGYERQRQAAGLAADAVVAAVAGPSSGAEPQRAKGEQAPSSAAAGGEASADEAALAKAMAEDAARNAEEALSTAKARLQAEGQQQAITSGRESGPGKPGVVEHTAGDKAAAAARDRPERASRPTAAGRGDVSERRTIARAPGSRVKAREARQVAKRVVQVRKSRGARVHYYTVAPGDTLGKLARRFLKDEDRYHLIRKANRGQIADADLIYPGQRLRIPKR